MTENSWFQTITNYSTEFEFQYAVNIIQQTSARTFESSARFQCCGKRSWWFVELTKIRNSGLDNICAHASSAFAMGRDGARYRERMILNSPAVQFSMTPHQITGCRLTYLVNFYLKISTFFRNRWWNLFTWFYQKRNIYLDISFLIESDKYVSKFVVNKSHIN